MDEIFGIGKGEGRRDGNRRMGKRKIGVRESWETDRKGEGRCKWKGKKTGSMIGWRGGIKPKGSKEGQMYDGSLTILSPTYIRFLYQNIA